MITKLPAILLLVTSLAYPVSASDLPAFFQKADAFFKKNVTRGSVNYAGINKAEMNSLYTAIGSMKLDGFDENFKKAFYINAYNLIVIQSILERFPVKSPMDIEGFFDKRSHTVAGESMTLNALEKEKLLIPYKDARFHFVLVCAAKSCPPLPSEAFIPDQLERQLSARTKLSLDNDQWLKVSAKAKKVEVSKIFDWYKGDFIGQSTLLEWINKYRSSKIPKDYSVSFYEYDWSLND
jgi:Protein of unknown function, DUF547